MAPKSTEKELSIQEIVERLRLRSRDLVADLYTLTTRQLDVEDKRETSLNTKAVSLLSASGVSVTVLFALGGALAQRPEVLESLAQAGTPWRLVLTSLYFVALLSGVAGGVLAVLALKVSAYVTVSEPDVFGDELSTADERTDPDRYRRYVTAHLWLIYRAQFNRHERKARVLRYGQSSFLVFLLLMIPLGLSMANVLNAVRPTGAAPPQPSRVQVASPSSDNHAPAPDSSEKPTPAPPARDTCSYHRPPSSQSVAGRQPDGG
jgi:hypothetical protein